MHRPLCRIIRGYYSLATIFLKPQQYINRRKISSRDPTQLQNTTRHAVLKNGCVTSSTAKYLRINTLRNTFEGAAHPSYIHIQQQADRRSDGRGGQAYICVSTGSERARRRQTRPDQGRNLKRQLLHCPRRRPRANQLKQ